MIQSKTAGEYSTLIKKYFKRISGRFHIERVPVKNVKTNEQEFTTIKIWDQEPEPALFSGLAFYLGFSSLQEFEWYEQNGEHKTIIKRARLQVEAQYEKKLHQPAPTGAIFVLKSMGWVDRGDLAAATDDTPKSLLVQVVQTGPGIASSEKEVEI